MTLWRKLRKLKKAAPEAQARLWDEAEKSGGPDRKDLLAMVIAAFLVILPAAALALATICLPAWLFLL